MNIYLVEESALEGGTNTDKVFLIANTTQMQAIIMAKDIIGINYLYVRCLYLTHDTKYKVPTVIYSKY